MATSNSSTVDALLAALKNELEDAPADCFERLAADLFCRLLGDVGVSVSKPGSQFGGDAGTAGLRKRHLRLECKRYKESSQLSPRSLAGEVMEAAVKDPQLEAWVLASTKAVSETERNIARDGGAILGVPVVVIDWTEPPVGLGINAMAALCAKWPAIVEQHVGSVAGAAAKALTAAAGQTAENLIKDLETWSIGFNHLRAKSHACLRKLWTDRTESVATLNQDAAGGQPGIYSVERRNVLPALDAWWQTPCDPRSPAMAVGLEGAGKTWASLDWMSRSAGALPIVVPVPASKFLNHQDLSEAGVRELLAESLCGIAGSRQGREFWRARVGRLLERPVGEGATVLLFVDGINQRPAVGWEALFQALQGDSLAGKVRILCTSRRHFFDVNMRNLASLAIKPTQVPVGGYSQDELGELLRLHGMDGSDIPESLLNLASTPRLFPLIVRLKSSDALRADATVLRLLFEYGKDVHQLRTSSALTDEAWVAWLGGRALEYRKRLMSGSAVGAATITDVTHSLAEPGVAADDVARRLSDVVDGNFFQVHEVLTGGKRYSLKEQPTVLGLGIALLESLDSAENTLDGVQAHAQKWLEPIGAIDATADVLSGALSILAALGSSDGIPSADALLLLWLNAQNPAANFERDALAFGESFPRSMLTVIEQSATGSRSAAFHCATQSIRRLPRSRTEDWHRIQQRMLEWCSWITIPSQAQMNDPNHFAGRHKQRLLDRLGVCTAGCVLVHGESMKLGERHLGEPAAAIPGILEGHDLTDFLPVIRRAAVREVTRVDLDSRCWDGLRWVLLLASQNETQVRGAIVKMAESMLVSIPEVGIHDRLRNSVAAYLLRLTNARANEERALSIDETFGSTWDYHRDYATDPGNSFFGLEFRHLNQVLNDTNLSVSGRLEKLRSYLALPGLKLPDVLTQAIKDAMAGQRFERVDEFGATTLEEHRLERLEVLAARFAPGELAEMSRRRLADLATRAATAKYWSALAAPELLLIAQEVHSHAFTKLRTLTVDPRRDELANTWCLQLELLHKPLKEQMRQLLSSTNFHFLTDLVSVVRPASSAALLDFIRSNPSNRVKACNVAMQIMAHQVPIVDEALVNELLPFLEDNDADLRAVAFVALASCSPDLTGRKLMSIGWKPDVADLWTAHYGSMAIVAASKHLSLPDVLNMVAPWRWLDAAVARGGQFAELDLATKRTIEVLNAPADTVAHSEWVLSVRVPKPAELPRVHVAESSQGVADMGAFLRNASQSQDQLQRRMDELSADAAAAIDKTRSGGHSLYLHAFSPETLGAAYKATPSLWDGLLAGVEERSALFVSRVNAATGLYLALCEILLEQAPKKGVRLWHALEATMRVRFNGAAKISELVHIALRAPESAEVATLRAGLLDLGRCNTDQDLFELVIACQWHGRETWLEGVIDADRSSDKLWKNRRGAVLHAFCSMPSEANLLWPEGRPVGAQCALESNLLKWTNQGVLAKLWWERFLAAADSDSAFAAWHVFLSVADRRALVWSARRPKVQTELDRLRELHLQSNEDLYVRRLERAEEGSAKLADRLFGLEAPGKWLMLDGALSR